MTAIETIAALARGVAVGVYDPALTGDDRPRVAYIVVETTTRGDVYLLWIEAGRDAESYHITARRDEWTAALRAALEGTP